MSKRACILVLLLVLSLSLFVALRVELVRAESTVYIRDDGSIDPPTAPITRNGDIYTLTGNISSDGNGIVVERDDAIVDGAGYTISGTIATDSRGVDLSGRNNVTVRNIKVNAFYFGVYLYSSSEINVSGSLTEGNMASGICLCYSSGNSLSGNNIAEQRHFYGIFFYSSSNNSVAGNNITDNHYGIYLFSSSEISVSGNYVANNMHGINLVNSSGNNSIFGNTLLGNGLFVLDSYKNNVEFNSVNGKPLIYLENAADHTVTDAGQVVLVNCNNMLIENLNLSNASVGVELFNTTDTRIANNDITGNSVSGLHICSSSNNNKIIGNKIENNALAIIVLSSSNNTVYHNNFAHNTGQIWTDHYEILLNFWDDGYPSGGNYWSDYTGPDHDYDGIGDTPYVIDEYNTDNYPLMASFGTILGDVNGDGYVGIDDIFLIAMHFSNEIGDSEYSRTYDLNGDGYVGIDDIFHVALHFGEGNPVESLFLIRIHVWYNSSGDWSEAAMLIINVGGTEVLLDRILVRGQECPWNSVYLWQATEVISHDLEATSTSLEGPSFNITVQGQERVFQQATGDIILASGTALVIYIGEPDTITLGDVGNTVEIDIFTSKAQYVRECNVEATQ